MNNLGDIKMINPINGINEALIDKLIIEIYDYADKINSTLTCIDELVQNTNIYFDCESADLFRNNFNNVKANFKIVNKNILDYSNDYVKIKNNYNHRRITIIKNFNQYKEEAEAKNIEVIKDNNQ